MTLSIILCLVEKKMHIHYETIASSNISFYIPTYKETNFLQNRISRRNFIGHLIVIDM